MSAKVTGKMCFLLASIHIHCRYLTLRPLICAFNPLLMESLLEPSDVIQQLTNASPMTYKMDRHLQTVIAEPLNSFGEYFTFSQMTPAYGVLDCTHFDENQGIAEVHAFDILCPTYQYAGSKLNPQKSRDNQGPFLEQLKEDPNTGLNAQSGVSGYTVRRKAPQNTDGEDPKGCSLQFLSARLAEPSEQLKGRNRVLCCFAPSRRDERVVMEPDYDRLLPISLPRSLLCQLKEGCLGWPILGNHGRRAVLDFI
jgi:hypothetical protein